MQNTRYKSVSRSVFPDDFLFGSATAAYQIEGTGQDDMGRSIWDDFCETQGAIENGDTGAVACDHYSRWAADLDLIRDGGQNAYRFSISWPRVMPDGAGAASEKGLAFYDRLIDGLLERGIQPFATLYHWDLPSRLQEKGGWMNRDVAAYFADYAALITQRFGDRLASIATINEPWCVANRGHMHGSQAPGMKNVRAATQVQHFVLLAHGAAVERMRAERPDGPPLGIVLNNEAVIPFSQAEADQKATQRWDGIFNRWYWDGVLKGAYPADMLEDIGHLMPQGFEDDMKTVSVPLDWLGVNYYRRGTTQARPEEAYPSLETVRSELPVTDMGWCIYPDGLYKILTRLKREYTDLPLYVTENGAAFQDVVRADGSIHDQGRVDYFDGHLNACARAIAEGVDLRGYFAWSTIDNFEWAYGYAKRFGIVRTCPQTLDRMPKASYYAYKNLATGA